MWNWVLRCGAAAVLLSVTASAQTLGELARKEEERRKAITSSGKVYTNGSVKSEPAPRTATPAVPPPTSPATPAATPAGDAPAAPATAPADETKKDEAYWRKRIESARTSLSRAEIFAEALQSRINGLSADFVARDDPAQRAVIGADRNKALAELERVKGEIQQHTKAIADVQDEARRAKVPPGWLR